MLSLCPSLLPAQVAQLQWMGHGPGGAGPAAGHGHTAAAVTEPLAISSCPRASHTIQAQFIPGIYYKYSRPLLI